MSNVFQRENSVFFGNTVYVSEVLYTNVIKSYPRGSSNPVSICDVKIKDDKIIGNLEGNVSGVLFGSANPERVVTIAQSGGLFDNFPDALAHAISLNPVPGNSVLIRCSPGTYLINDTLMWPGYVDFTADNANVVLAITDPNKNVIELQPGVTIIDRLMVSGATNACGFVRNTPGNATLLWCQIFSCYTGVLCENPGSFMRLVTTGSPGGLNVFALARNTGQIGTTTVLVRLCGTGIKAEDTGVVRLIDTIIEDCGTAFDLTNCTSELSSCQIFNCATGILAGTGAKVEGTNINTFNCATDINVAADVVSFRLGNTKIDEAKMIIADDSKVALNINDIKARDKFFGTAAVFDIQQIDLFGTSDAGGRKPTLTKVVDDGSIVVNDLGLYSDATAFQRVEIPNSASMVFSSSYTLEFWMKPNPNAGPNQQFVFSKRNTFDIKWRRGFDRLEWSHRGASNLNTDRNLILGNTRVHIACVMDSFDKTMTIYVNGVPNTDRTFSGTLNNTTSPLYICDKDTSGNKSYNGGLDEINFWSKALTSDEVEDRYNNGKGSVNTDTTDLMAGYHCNNDGTATELIDYSPNENDGTHDCTFGPGLILDASPSVGVISWFFQPNEINELFFNIHPNATYQEGKNITPIIHWMPSTDDVGDIVWCLETSTANPGVVYPDSNISTVTVAASGTRYEHIVTELPPFVLSNFQAIILGRLFREGNNVADTYNNGVILLGFELKFTKNKLGSDT